MVAITSVETRWYREDRDEDKKTVAYKCDVIHTSSWLKPRTNGKVVPKEVDKSNGVGLARFLIDDEWCVRTIGC